LEENLTMVPPCDCVAEKTAVSAKKDDNRPAVRRTFSTDLDAQTLREYLITQADHM